jgi:hypothetical protein
MPLAPEKLQPQLWGTGNPEESNIALDHARELRSLWTFTAPRNDFKKTTDTYAGGRRTTRLWMPVDGGVMIRSHTLEWIAQMNAGDGTVPSDSQWAEAATPGEPQRPMGLTTTNAPKQAPKHMDSTKSADVWRDIVMTIHTSTAPKDRAATEGAARKARSQGADQEVDEDAFRFYVE